jgi:ketosteroid isomerase-like protein
MPVAPADDRVSEVITAAFEADARMDSADSLYQAEAEVIANGERRFAPPRFAGIEPGGGVAVASTRVEFRGGLAWSLVEYRWMSTAAGRAVEGRATFLLEPGSAGAWRIRHAHSSTAEP